MRTEIQGNGILPDYCSTAGRDCNAATASRSLHHQNQFLKSGQNHDSSQITKDGFLGYDKGQMRKTILKHETIFRNQVKDLHRLYIRQTELMNEMKRMKLHKDEWTKPFTSLIQDSRNLAGTEMPLSKSTIFDDRIDALDVPANVLGSNVENQMRNSFYKFSVVETPASNRSHQASYAANSAFNGVWRPECKVDSLNPYLISKEFSHWAGLNLANSIDWDLSRPRADVPVNSGSTVHLASTNFNGNPLDTRDVGICFSIMNTRNEMCGKDGLADGYTEEKRLEKHSFSGDFCFDNSQTCSKGVLAEPRTGFFDNRLTLCKSVSHKKQKLFGVEISEENDDSSNMVSNMSNIIIKNDLINCTDVGDSAPRKCLKNMDETKLKPIENSEGETEYTWKFRNVVPQQLPWFLKYPQHRGKPKNGVTNSYFMNLDTLQNYSNDFFKKTETVGGDRKEQLEDKDSVLQGLNNCFSGLRHHIDLNLSFQEEEAPPASSLPTAIVKIATTEIDLEIPAMIESEADVFPTQNKITTIKVPPTNPEPCSEECDRIAAETMISISMSGKKNSTEEVACEPLGATSSDCLKWFAETILSNCSDNMRKASLDQIGACEADESIPNGLDCFEFMTLKLEDTKEEHYSYKPVELNNPSDEETRDATLSKSRRGMPNRGRQLRDFQRDILPGLVTLSRHEVTEDLKTLLKVEDRNSPRNGRGRRSFRVLTTSAASKSFYSTMTQQPTRQKLGLEGRNILGWGKRTRRLPRQRYPNTHLSVPLKC